MKAISSMLSFLAPTVLRIFEHSLPVRRFCIAKDTLAALEGRNRVKLWNYTNGELRSTVTTSHAEFTSIALNDNFLFTGLSNGTVTVRNLQTGEEICAFDAHPGGVANLSANNTLLVSGGLFDCSVQIRGNDWAAPAIPQRDTSFAV